MKFSLTIFLTILSFQILFSQETKLRVIGENRVNDSLILRTCEILIFNNQGHPICLKVSTSFDGNILSSDTIQLATLKVEGCYYYKLEISKEDTRYGGNEFPAFPVILNPKTCFVATISMIYQRGCSSWIELNYVSQEGVNYNDILAKYRAHLGWDKDLNLKFKNKKIFFPGTSN